MVQTPSDMSTFNMTALISALQHLGVGTVLTPASSANQPGAPSANPSLGQNEEEEPSDNAYVVPARSDLMLPAFSIPYTAIAVVGVPEADPPPPPSPTPIPTAQAATDTGTDDSATGFVCQSCGAHNLLKSSKGTWYLVTSGRAVGVFLGW